MKNRLDTYLVEKGFFQSRNKASEAIKDEKVKVDGKTICKPSFEVCEESTVEIEEALQYVSRAAYKLLSLLEHYSVEFYGKRVLDVGASTGGFTQVALQNGAESVVCVDVGKSQLHPKIQADTRVQSLESCDIRDFVDEAGFAIVLCDVSFISVTYIASALASLAKESIILLFKPQFEVGKESKRDKNGVVQNRADIELAKERAVAVFQKLGWKKIYEQFSEVSGKEGNREIFLCFGRA